MTTWKGVFPAVTTKLKKDESLDIEATQASIDRLIKNGVSGVTAIFSASGGSVGALPQPWPIARLSTTRPCCRMHS